MGAVENTNRVIAAALIAPMPTDPFTAALQYSKGVRSFTRLGVGRYTLVLEEPGGSNELVFDFGQPVNQNLILGAQVIAGGAISITAYDGTQTPVDPRFFYFNVLKYSESEGQGITLPVATALSPLSGGSALVGYIYNFVPNSPDDITSTQVRLGRLPRNVAVSNNDLAPVVMSSFAPLLIDSDVVGAGGLDTGILADDSWYALYVIASEDGATVAGLMSLEFGFGPDPLLPVGYTKYRRVGSIRSEAGEGGATLVKTFTCQGMGNDRRYQWDSAINVLPNPSSATVVTPVALIDACPPFVSDYVQVRVTLESPAGTPGTLFYGQGLTPGHLIAQNASADPGGTPLLVDYFVQGVDVVALDQTALAVPTLNYNVSDADQQASMDLMGWFESI